MGDLSEFAHVVAVVNPKGRLAVDRVEQILRANLPPGGELSIRTTQPEIPVHGIVEQELESATLAIAVGGDGTISQVAAAILERQIPLGMIPAGSTNMVAKVSGVPSNPEHAARLIFGQNRREWIDVGRSGERLLLHMGGAGIDARIFEQTGTSLKRRFRWLAYVPAGIASALHPGSNFTLTIDDQVIQIRARLVLIANSAQLIIPQLRIANDVSRSDGLFEVIVFTADDRWSLLRTGTRFLANRLPSSAYVATFQGSNIRVEAEPNTPAEIDGEVVGSTPLEVKVTPNALQLICS